MEIYIYFILQDQLSADMYNFASKEGDYARYYVMVGTSQFTVDYLKWKCNANMFYFTITILFGDTIWMTASLYAKESV